MAQGSILTDVGKAKLASATPLDQVNITDFAVGDGGGGYPTLDSSMTSLVNEVWRGPASTPIRDPENTNIIIFETNIPPNDGGFFIRELALFDDAGDMIAIGQTPVVEKPLPGEDQGVSLILRMYIALDNADQVSLVYQDGTGTMDHGGLGNRNAFDAHPKLVGNLLNVTELRATPGVIDNQQVSVLGNDGRGWMQVCWDADSTEADDDQNVFAVSGVTNGRWKIIKIQTEFGYNSLQSILDASYQAIKDRAIYVRSLSELEGLPSPLTNQSVIVQGAEFSYDGTEWRNLSGFWCPEMYPELVSGSDWADALQASATAAAGRTWRANASSYQTRKQITFEYGTHIDANGECLIDGSLITISGDAPDNAVVRLGDGSLTQISGLSANAIKDENLLNFSSAHGLSEGQYGCIYNPTDFSFNPFRAEYRDGEWFQVAEVISSTEVRTVNPLFATHVFSDVDVYVLSGGSFSFSGKFKSSCIGSGVTLSAISLYRVVDTDISGISGRAVSNNAGVQLNQCVNIYGTAVVATQSTLSGIGTDYGLSIANSQHIDITGYFSASRHGVSHGGFSGPGAVPVRDSKIRGTVSTDNSGLTQAADWHGNCERCLFDGTIMGGVSAGGRGNSVRGTISADVRGFAVLFGEVGGVNFDFSGCTIKAVNNSFSEAGGRGLIDFGGGGAVDHADTLGGVLDFSGCTIEAPVCERILTIRARARTGLDHQINLSGFYIKSASSTGTLVLIDTLNAGTGNWGVLNLNNFKMFGSGVYSVSGVSRVVGRVSGITPVTTSTSAAAASAPVTLPFDFGVEPSVKVTFEGGFISGVAPVAHATSVSSSGFNVWLGTPDVSNFGSEVTRDIHWTAEVDYYS